MARYKLPRGIKRVTYRGVELEGGTRAVNRMIAILRHKKRPRR